jgi:hypothetical protein
MLAAEIRTQTVKVYTRHYQLAQSAIVPIGPVALA